MIYISKQRDEELCSLLEMGDAEGTPYGSCSTSTFETSFDCTNDDYYCDKDGFLNSFGGMIGQLCQCDPNDLIFLTETTAYPQTEVNFYNFCIIDTDGECRPGQNSKCGMDTYSYWRTSSVGQDYLTENNVICKVVNTGILGSKYQCGVTKQCATGYSCVDSGNELTSYNIQGGGDDPNYYKCV